jgi:hypothetical protein
MNRTTIVTTLKLTLATALFAAATLNTCSQTWQTILDLGPMMNGYDVLANPFPNSPLPPRVFVAADSSGPDNEIAFFDTAQRQSAGRLPHPREPPGYGERPGPAALLGPVSNEAAC